MRNIYFIVLLTLITILSCEAQKDRAVGGGCEACELLFEAMPDNLSPKTTIAKPDEGEPIIIEGVIYKRDGKTPAPNVILYVYHTDSKGYYSNGPRQPETRHGQLRGWIKTGNDGKYQFTTIRPAPYPTLTDPQHIHPIIKEPGLSVYYIDEYIFEDDPLVTKEVRAKEEKRGGSGVIPLTKKDGVWYGKRDIVLGLNVPGY